MQSNREKEDKSTQITDWAKSYSKSLIDNSQLSFSKKITVSIINTEDNLPYSEIIDIHEIINSTNINNSIIISLIDNRTIFYKLLKSNTVSYMSNFFPLTREKYKMSNLIFSFSGNNENILSMMNESQLKAYAKLNYKYMSKTYKDSLSISEEEYINESLEYYQKLISQLSQCNPEEFLNKYWKKLNNEEKLFYESVDKDSIKPIECKEKNLEKDVENFEAQDGNSYSKNFAVLLFIPLDIEHSIFPMPQVVANTRNPNFESLMKPHKKPKKYYFILNFIDQLWHFKELNV